MALRKDGNGKRSTSYKPYDSSNSFVKKMTNTLTGLFGRRSDSQSNIRYNDLSYSSAEEDNISPVAKRMRVECEEKNALSHLIPNSSREQQSLCSPIQSVNDVTVVSSSNKYPISSTPANILYSSTTKNAPPPALPNNTKNTSNTKIMQTVEEEDVAPSTSTSLPQFNFHQRHNITVPSTLRDMPSRASNLDTTKSLSGSISSISSRRPSFNVDLFSSSNRRLSLSVCENRNRSCLSPFYSARTLYGGASALLPYGSQSACRVRSASTSKLDVFSPHKSNITMQPVPSPVQTNDQEMMSAAARRILDTLEKYCSPVADAKRIPLNESSKKMEDDTSQRTPRGTKRKLPSLNQMMPSTSDLLRLKRTERIQDSISSAKQTMSTVPERSIIEAAAEDSDSSADSTELDYSALTDDTKKDRGAYMGKIRTTGKRGKKFDDRPLTPVKLPHVSLKMTNLPKFNVAEFKFSKPLPPESLDRTPSPTPVAAPTAAPPPVSTVAAAEKRSASAAAKDYNIKPISTETTIPKSVPATSTSSLSSSNSSVMPTKISFSPTIAKRAEEPKIPTMKPSTTINAAASTKAADVKASSIFGAGTTNNSSWTCKYDLTSNTRDKCNTCLAERESPVKPIEPPKLPAAVTKAAVTTAAAMVTSTTTATTSITTPASVSGWGDKFKPATDKWKCDECWSFNPNTDAKCPACQTPRYKTSAGVANNASTAQSSTTAVSNEFKMPQFGGIPASSEKIIKENGEKPNPAAVSSSPSNDVGGESTPGKKWTISFGKNEPTKNIFATKSDNTAMTTTTMTTNSTSNNIFSVKTNDDKPSFGSFGAVKNADAPAKPLFPAVGFTPSATQPSNSSIFGQSAADLTAAETKSSSSPKFSFGSIAMTATSGSGGFQFGKAKMENTTSGGLTNDTQTPANISVSAPSDAATTTTSEEKVMAKPVMTNAFGSPSSGQLSFAAEKKSESNNAPLSATFSFGAPAAATNSGGFIFNNGPKADGVAPSPPKFGFGATANAASSGAISFGNATTSASTPFTFTGASSASVTTTNDTAPPLTNSIFTNAVRPVAENAQQPQNNAFSIFGSPKATATQQQSPITANKKSGGFSFASPNQFGIPQANHFSGTVTTTSQVTSSPMGNSIFGSSSNTAAPQTSQTFGMNPTSTFNFGAGNSLPAFPNAAQPLTTTATTAQTNSVFRPAGKRLNQDDQLQQNAAAVTPSQISFTNVFGNAISQTGPQPVKKSGGFNFPSEPNEMNAANTIGGFATGADNQNNLANNTSNSFVFGTASNQNAQSHNFNLTVPNSFNFTGGNALSTFSAQPAAAGTTQNALPGRKIKKAVRRTARN